MTRNPLRDPVLWMASALVLATTILGVSSSLEWIGRPFPGFLVLDNGVVASAGLADWPAAGGELYQHQLVSADGEAVRGGEDLLERTSRLEPGTPVEYRFRQGEREFARVIEVRRFDGKDYALLFGAFLLNGLAMAATALGVRFLRGSHPLANAAFPLLLASSIWGLSAMDLYGPYRLFRLHALAEVLLVPGFVAMALGFPDRAVGERSHRALLAAAWALSLALVVVYQWGIHEAAAYVRWHLAATLLIGLTTGALVLSQALRFLRSRSFEARQRIKVLALGTAAAFTLPAALNLQSALSGGQGGQNAIAFTAFIFPLALGYAVLRHNLLGVDLLIRRSLVYLLLSGVVTAAYAGAAAALDALLGSTPEAEQLTAGVPILAALVVLPLRDRVQQVVDRLFFRSAYDFARTVEAASSRLAGVAQLEVVADEIETAVREALAPDQITLYARPSKDEPFLSVGGASPPPEVLDYEHLLSSSGEIWEREDSGLLVPFWTQQMLVAFLDLGPRRDGKLYGGEDRRLLKVLANQGAVAIRNSFSLEQVRELNRSLEAKVALRTAELGDALDRLQEQNRQLEEISSTDPLTGLRSRRFGTEALAGEMLAARDTNGQLSILIIDLDHFKKVNDRHGHSAGDEALRTAGRVLRAALRERDVALRYGGEELLVVLPGATLDDAAQRAEEIREAVAGTPIRYLSATFRITVSIGAAEWEGETLSELIDRADVALYEAKDGGRDCVALAPPLDAAARGTQREPPARGLRRAAERREDVASRSARRVALRSSRGTRREALVRELERAIERDEIRLVYQPRISLHDGRCVGAEALARWRSRSLGVISPSEFIALAEDTRLIVPLGASVLRRACRDAVRFAAAAPGPFCVSVNVSPIQFRDAGIATHVTDALCESGLAPNRLELEITERCVMQESGPGEERMHELRRIGVRFALDDFGAGFSALSCLTNLPLSTIKLDRSLVQGAEGSQLGGRLIQGTIAMAHGLGLGVVAEGVASAESMEFLRGLGCDEAQGFWIAPGMPRHAMERFVSGARLDEKPLREAPWSERRTPGSS